MRFPIAFKGPSAERADLPQLLKVRVLKVQTLSHVLPMRRSSNNQKLLFELDSIALTTRAPSVWY